MILQSLENWNGRTRTCALVDSCDCFFLLSYVPVGACICRTLRRASFGFFPWADAAQFSGQAVTPDRHSKYIHKEVKKR